MANTQIAVVVAGSRNLTRITGLRLFYTGALEDLAKVVARKEPGKTYYIQEFSATGMQRKKGDPLYVWHVGDGFEHSEGWWVETES